MKIYLDLIFFMNFFYDFLLLLTVSLVLKRKRKIKYYFLASLFGALSIFILFLPINSFILFFDKIIVSIIMCLIAYGFVSLRYIMNNIIYLYMCSVILAGFLYFVDLEFSLEHQGIIFIFKDVNPNHLVLMVLSPIILFMYYRSSKKLKNTYNLYYNIEIFFDDQRINCLALFDNGNNLLDPVTHKGIIILNKKKLQGITNIRSPVYVPYNTVTGSSLMKCYKPSYIMINHHKIYNYLVGESECHFSDGVECLLNKKLGEDNYV